MMLKLLAGLLLLGAATKLPVPQTLKPEPGDEIQYAASVVKVTELMLKANAGVKLFGTAGGDPAMNGLNTYIGFYASPAEGWTVFKIGDFLDYTVVAQAPGRVTLGITESVYNEKTGRIGSRVRRVGVSWSRPPDGTAPMAVRVTGG